MAKYIVTGALATATDQGGMVRYFYRGDELPEWVGQDRIDHLLSVDLISEAGSVETHPVVAFDPNASAPTSAADADSSADGGYDSQTVEELKAEIDRRNADLPEGEQISKSGNKGDLVAALQDSDSR